MSDLFQEIKAELKREGVQGTMELANALFNGTAFVPYGPGQYTPSPPSQDQSMESQEPELTRETSGRE